MNVDESLQRAQEATKWVHEQLNGLQLPGMQKRQHLGCASLHAAIEHSQAIVLLVEADLAGSALALLRLTFEAFVRGAWILFCADEIGIENAGADRLPRFGAMVRDLETLPRYESKGLSGLKAGAWAMLNSMTHAGTAQTLSRIGEGGIGSAFSSEEKALALDWATKFGYLAVLEFATLAQDEKKAQSAVYRIAGKPEPQAE